MSKRFPTKILSFKFLSLLDFDYIRLLIMIDVVHDL